MKFTTNTVHATIYLIFTLIINVSFIHMMLKMVDKTSKKIKIMFQKSKLNIILYYLMFSAIYVVASDSRHKMFLKHLSKYIMSKIRIIIEFTPDIKFSAVFLLHNTLETVKEDLIFLF